MSPLVKRYLEERGAAFSVVTHRPLISFEDAKEILPHDPGNMVKSLVFRCADDSLAIVALRAAERADYKKIAGALGERRADLRMAEEECVRDRLDMEIGGVVPLPINGARVFVDRGVLELEEVVCGTGRNTVTLVIALSELVRVAQAEVADLSKPAGTAQSSPAPPRVERGDAVAGRQAFQCAGDDQNCRYRPDCTWLVRRGPCAA